MLQVLQTNEITNTNLIWRGMQNTQRRKKILDRQRASIECNEIQIHILNKSPTHRFLVKFAHAHGIWWKFF